MVERILEESSSDGNNSGKWKLIHNIHKHIIIVNWKGKLL